MSSAAHKTTTPGTSRPAWVRRRSWSPRPAAAETDKDKPLIRDPYAKVLVAGAGTGIWEFMLDDEFVAKVGDADPESRRDRRAHGQLPGLCARHFFDEFLRSGGVRGYPSDRHPPPPAWTHAPTGLQWPGRHHGVTNSTSPRLLEYKAATLDQHGAPTCPRTRS